MAPKRGDSWFVRVHRTYEELEPWVQNLAEKCDKLVVYEHEADEEVNRLHCHLMIIGYKTSDETMKAQLTKVLGQRPEKTDWAWDPEVRSEESTIAYMSKKDLHAKFVKGVSADMIAECSAKYVPKSEYGKRQGKTQYSVIAEKPEVSKKRQNDLLDEMIKRYKDMYPMDKYIDTESYPFCSKAVLRVIIEVLNDNRTIFGRYKVRDYYDTICARMWASKFQNMVLTMMGFVTKENLAFMS